jgi:hypothetical protein
VGDERLPTLKTPRPAAPFRFLSLLHNSGDLRKRAEQRPASMSQRNLAGSQGAASRPGSSALYAPSLLRCRARWRILLRGNGSRTGSALILAWIAFKVLI